MEKTHTTEKLNDAFALRKRVEKVSNLVEHIQFRQDAEFSYYCLILLFAELDDAQKGNLVRVICADQSSVAEQMAFDTLNDLPELDEQNRNALFERIVASGDKTTCNMTLLFVKNLGAWESRLQDVLAR